MPSRTPYREMRALLHHARGRRMGLGGSEDQEVSHVSLRLE